MLHRYTGELSKDCTHLLVDRSAVRKGSLKLDAALSRVHNHSWEVLIVKSAWLWACNQSEERQDEHAYLLNAAQVASERQLSSNAASAPSSDVIAQQLLLESASHGAQQVCNPEFAGTLVQAAEYAAKSDNDVQHPTEGATGRSHDESDVGMAGVEHEMADEPVPFAMTPRLGMSGVQRQEEVFNLAHLTIKWTSRDQDDEEPEASISLGFIPPRRSKPRVSPPTPNSEPEQSVTFGGNVRTRSGRACAADEDDDEDDTNDEATSPLSQLVRDEHGQIRCTDAARSEQSSLEQILLGLNFGDASSHPPGEKQLDPGTDATCASADMAMQDAHSPSLQGETGTQSAPSPEAAARRLKVLTLLEPDDVEENTLDSVLRHSLQLSLPPPSPVASLNEHHDERFSWPLSPRKSLVVIPAIPRSPSTNLDAVDSQDDAALSRSLPPTISGVDIGRPNAVNNAAAVEGVSDSAAEQMDGDSNADSGADMDAQEYRKKRGRVFDEDEMEVDDIDDLAGCKRFRGPVLNRQDGIYSALPAAEFTEHNAGAFQRAYVCQTLGLFRWGLGLYICCCTQLLIRAI